MPKTDNDFWFGTTGDMISPQLYPQITTRQQAYRTAAWIKLMGSVLPHEEGEDEATFEEVEEAIMNT